MRLAFWRRKDAADDEIASATSAPRARKAQRVQQDEVADEAQLLRRRARRRLIGAAALLLAAAILVPLILDPAPRSVPDDVPIDIPSERTPFKPRLALPPVPDPATVPLAPAPETAEPATENKKAEQAQQKSQPVEQKAEQKTEQKPETKDTARDDGARARAILEGKSSEPTKERVVLQAAAFGNASAAKQLADRLKKAGLPAYTERVEVKNGERHRVRIGPFASRDEAERARVRMQEMDVKATVVAGR